MKQKYTAYIKTAAAARLAIACLIMLIAASAPAFSFESQTRLRKLNISKEGNNLYVKLTGTQRFRYRVKTENNPPRITVQLYNTESELGYENLAVNQGYVKDLRIQETVIGGQKATFILMHLNQSVSVDYGLSGDGRTLYLSTPIYAGANDSLKQSPYAAEAAVPTTPSASNSNNYALPVTGDIPPEIVVPGGAPSIQSPSEMVPYSKSSASALGSGTSTDFSQTRGVDNSPYIVGPVILQDADVSKAVQLLSEAAGGASIIVESKVLEASAQSVAKSGGAGGSGGGGITMTLTHVTLEDALDIITSANGWVWKKLANSYVIVSRETATKGLETITAAKINDITADKIQVTIYKPKYVDACTLVKYTTTTVPDGQCDKKLNLLVLRGRYEDIIKAKDILSSVDTPRSKSDLDSVETRMKQQTDMMGQTLVTRIVRLKYIRATDLEKQLTTLLDNPYFGNLEILNVNKSKDEDDNFSKDSKLMNSLSIDAGSNTLVFVGREEIYNRLLKVIQQLDVKFSATIVRTIQLQYAFTSDLKTDLAQSILDNLGRTSGGSSSDKTTNVMYNDMTNSITFIGTEDNFERFKNIIDAYDTEDKAVITEQFVFKNVLISDLLKMGMLDPILNSPTYGYTMMWDNIGHGTSGNTSTTLNSKTRISAYEPTNAMIITAQRRYIDKTKEFLRSLDNETDKVKTKFIKLRYVNALRIVNVAQRMLALYSAPGDEKNPEAIFGGFYDCGGKFEVKQSDTELSWTVSCAMTTGTGFMTSLTGGDNDPNKRYHFMSLIAEANQNAVVARGTQRDIERLMEIVQMMDVAYPQVKIDVQVVEVDTTDAKTFKNNLTYGDGKYSFTSSNSSSNETILAYNSVSSAATQLTNTLQYLIDANRASLLANPSIVTRENVFSYFQFVDVYRYTPPPSVIVPGLSATQTTTTNSAPSVQTGPSLIVIAHIDTIDNTVLLRMWPSYSTLNGISSDGLPQTGYQSMMQELVVKNGETIIASGFINSSEIEKMQRVPILSNLPLVGNLFKNKYTEKKSKEIIFMITPTILPIGG